MPNKKTKTQSAASLKEIGAARAQHAEEMHATYGAARLAQQELQGRPVGSVEADKEVSVSAAPVISEEPISTEPVTVEAVEPGSVEAVEPVSVEPVEPISVAEAPRSSRIAALARARMLGGGSASAGKTTVRDVIASRTIGGVSASVKQAVSDRLSKGRSAGKPKLPRVVG